MAESQESQERLPGSLIDADASPAGRESHPNCRVLTLLLDILLFVCLAMSLSRNAEHTLVGSRQAPYGRGPR